jgi:diguanylate cyclase (GGDEF)-like protein
MAAMTLDALATDQLFESLSLDVGSEGRSRPSEEPRLSSDPILRDATYLNVVLPFAIGQARRHREPLSLLCVEIDRIASIHQLLGAGAVDRAAHVVGEAMMTRLRTSDVVCRLDDDRLMAMLPCANGRDALRIAREICAIVKEEASSLPDLPPLTVSIGVADFPTCGRDVEGLLAAADDALNCASQQGRNMAVLAPRLPTELEPARIALYGRS